MSNSTKSTLSIGLLSSSLASLTNSSKITLAIPQVSLWLISDLGMFNQTVGKCTLRMFPPNHQFGRDAEHVAKAHLDAIEAHRKLESS